MKKIISLVLMIAMVLTSLSAKASEVRSSGDFQYTIKNNGTATVVGYSGTTDMIIPQMLDGYTVTAIGDNAFHQESVMKQEISVTLPNTIKSIGNFAFWNRNVRSINLPDTLEYIGKGAFVGCDDITYRISSNHPMFAVIDGALYNKSQKELIRGKEWVVIPEGIRSIGDYACYGISHCGINSEGIVLPSTIETIGDYAFYGNTYTISLPTHHSLEAYEGQYMKSEPVTNLIRRPFELIWGENIRQIGDYAFAESQIYITSRVKHDDRILVMPIPDSVTEIGEGCFYNFGSTHTKFDQAMKIKISNNSQLCEIPEKAFYNESSTCKIICNAPITTVGEYAFFNANIESFDMQSISVLGKGAFMKSKQMKDITIPASCKMVPEDCFNGVSALKNIAFTPDLSIIISDGVESIESNAFAEVCVESPVFLPNSLSNISADAFRKETEYIVEKGSYAYRWVDENAYNYIINGEEQNLDWLNN